MTTFEVLVDAAGKYAEFPRCREGGSLISETPALNNPRASLAQPLWLYAGMTPILRF